MTSSNGEHAAFGAAKAAGRRARVIAKRIAMLICTTKFLKYVGNV
jgi:hypothetical protein